eukprot:747410-Hanusia_phi.AAC.1
MLSSICSSCDLIHPQDLNPVFGVQLNCFPHDLSDFSSLPTDDLFGSPEDEDSLLPLWDQLTSPPDSRKLPAVTSSPLTSLSPSSFAEAVEAGGSNAAIAGAARKGRYAREACQFCRQRKLKCNDQRPCGKCMHFRMVCISQVGQRRGRKPKSNVVMIANSLDAACLKENDDQTRLDDLPHRDCHGGAVIAAPAETKMLRHDHPQRAATAAQRLLILGYPEPTPNPGPWRLRNVKPNIRRTRNDGAGGFEATKMT